MILAMFAIASRRGQGEFDARALTYTTMLVASLGLVLYVPALRKLFHFSFLHCQRAVV